MCFSLRNSNKDPTLDPTFDNATLFIRSFLEQHIPVSALMLRSVYTEHKCYNSVNVKCLLSPHTISLNIALCNDYLMLLFFFVHFSADIFKYQQKNVRQHLIFLTVANLSSSVMSHLTADCIILISHWMIIVFSPPVFFSFVVGINVLIILDVIINPLFLLLLFSLTGLPPLNFKS